jgi:hypothetical protein
LVWDTDGEIAVSATLIHGIRLIPGAIPIIGVILTTVILTPIGIGITHIGEVTDTATITGIGTGTMKIIGEITMDREELFPPPTEEETQGQIPPGPTRS